MAKFPFPSEAMTTTFDLMQYILQEPSPTLPKGTFTAEFEEFCKLCLLKDPQERTHPKKLIVVIFSNNKETAFIKRAKELKYDLKEFTSKLEAN